MDICTSSMKNNPPNFIIIYNYSEFILKLKGLIYTIRSSTPFESLNCFPGNQIQIGFSDNSTRMFAQVEMWVITEAVWTPFSEISKHFPGQYCFRASGTIIRPSLMEIPCPNKLNC